MSEHKLLSEDHLPGTNDKCLGTVGGAVAEIGGDGVGIEVNSGNFRLMTPGNGLQGGAGSVYSVKPDVTTGGQIILSAEELRSRGAIVENVLCVIVRDPKAFDNLSGKGLKLIPLFTMEEIKEIAE